MTKLGTYLNGGGAGESDKIQKSGMIFIVLFSIPISDATPPYKQLDQHDSSNVPCLPSDTATLFPLAIHRDSKHPLPSSPP